MQADLYSASGNILWVSVVSGLQAANLPDYAAVTQSLCQDKQADGVLLINPETHEVWMLNPDGSNGGFCGNGLQAVACHLSKGSSEIELEMSGVKIQARCQGHQVELVLAPKMSSIKAIKLEGVSAYQLTVPNPHCVILDPPQNWGFPEKARDICEQLGCNVEFVFLSRAQEGIQAIMPRVLVYERGAGPTGACGSGAIATFKVLQNLNVVTDQVTLAFPGGNLTVCRQEDKLLLSGLVKWIKTTCI